MNLYHISELMLAYAKTSFYFLSGLTEILQAFNFMVQITFHFLWDRWAYCGIFENGVLLMYTLEGVSSVANFITAYEESQ